MVDFYEAIPTKKETDELTARSLSAVALDGARYAELAAEQATIPHLLMSADGLSYNELSPSQWREIARYTRPEIFDLEERILPFSELALDQAF